MTMTTDQFFAQRKARQEAASAREKERNRRAAALPPCHKVYRYVFPDDKQYVGVTKLSLRRREQAHKDTLSAVGRRLLCFPLERPTVEVLAEFEDRQEAELFEREAILQIPEADRMNVVTTWKVKPMEPVDDWRRRVREGWEAQPVRHNEA